MTVSIEGLDRADVLAALYNASRVQGLGFLQAKDGVMERAEAQQLLAQTDYFDYLFGRVMKISLREGDVALEEWGYDRDNGQGAAQRVMDALRQSGATITTEIATMHVVGTAKAAEAVRAQLGTPTTTEKREGGTVVTLGLDGAVADALRDVLP